MAGDIPSTNGVPHEGALPPVEPPSARFILQLFLVPLLLVGIFGAAIFFLFGWMGVNATDPTKLMDDLESSTSEKVRWMAAQDLAQLLPRDAALQNDPAAALRMCEILKREMQKPPPPADDADQHDFLKFLPAAVSSFHMPVGVPLLQEIVATYHDKLDDEGDRIRLYNALVALGVSGAKAREFDALAPEAKDRLLGGLQTEALAGGERGGWAKLAFDYLTEREEHRAKAPREPMPDRLGLLETLTRAARSDDELTRKYAIVALGNWNEAGVEPLLLQLAGDHSDLTRFEDNNASRGIREIRHNAALALARRGSRLTPWQTVLETLDEETLRKQTYAQNNEMATAVLLKAVRDLRELRQNHPAIFDQQTDVKDALDKLAQSPTGIVQVEARKTLGGASAAAKGAPAVSREALLVGTLGLALVGLLALAAISRWRRKPAPPVAV